MAYSVFILLSLICVFYLLLILVSSSDTVLKIYGQVLNYDKLYAASKRKTVSFHPLPKELVKSQNYLDKSFERTLTVSIGCVKNFDSKNTG